MDSAATGPDRRASPRRTREAAGHDDIDTDTDAELRDDGGEPWGEYVETRRPVPGPTGWVPVLSPSGDPDGERLTVRPRRLPGDSTAARAGDAPVDRGAGAREVDVVVVGAGQAGLATAYRLQRRGLVGYAGDPVEQTGATRHRGHVPDFVVLDAEDGPGGAWRHRWHTLTMATVNGIHDLPGAGFPEPDPVEPASTALPRYFTTYEDMFDLPVLRPVVVMAVERADDDPRGRLLVHTDQGSWAARAVVSATGTWSRPFWPTVPGVDRFRGRQLHTHDYAGPEEHEGDRVAVVGGGISGVGHVLELSHAAEALWYTRTPPRWSTGRFDHEAGRGVEERVTARVEQGLRPLPVVAETGLFLGPATRRAMDAGVLARRPMFTEMTEHSVREADGTLTPVDTILWATGFRHELRHLKPMRIRTRDGGVLVRGTEVVDEPRLHLVGYGAGASTVGATRAGRRAVAAIIDLLG
ncbi:NAD(P)-binding domain-containing protein [Georgenia sp. Z1491]|uniref:NAD(P)-binding domain-containing protein n=1 Tax=Georgenia sp. Z1491 TaxID=3416707 RepID=UPI003CE7CF6A